MNRVKSKCIDCSAEFELELGGFSFWERRKTPSIYECPNCSKKYYIREPEWLNSLTWNGVKISKRFKQEQIITSKEAFNVDLDAKEVYGILISKGVKYFHHANTVSTSKTFLESKALLSRENIETNNLYQTPQKSDGKDKQLGINNYVFLDGKDLAAYFSRPNKYGPVLFKLDLKLLLSDEINTVRITRKNPIYWNFHDGLNDRYYNNLKEFEDAYLTGDKLGDGGTMFMFQTTNGSLSLEKYLQEISVDNPNLIFTDSTTLVALITNFLQPELNQLGQQLKVLNRFMVQYNWMRAAEPEKYRKFFTTKRE
jgi:DNA-directed RNA polymerase subunit RPC12/RpoP